MLNILRLLAASQPSTPVKTEPPSALVGNVPVATSISGNSTDEISGGGDTTRFLNASGPLLTPGGLAGFPHPMEHETAFRAAMAQGALPFPAIYPGLHPAEMKPEMIGAVRAVSGYFFDPMPYHPYASGLDGTRRKNATRETTAPLKSWLNEHRKNPYPTKAEKIMLALLTKMTLTQENKMTWSPRNRPGEDDDDDLGDIDASSEQNHSDRPCSSASDGDISVVINDSSEQDQSGDVHSKSVTPPPCSETSDNLPRSSAATISIPRKTKIWSIAETLSNNTAEANNSSSTAYGSSKDDRERASTSADRKSWGDGRDSIPPSDSAATGPSMVSSVPPPLLPPSVSAVTAANGQIPQHFLQFHPWQQQQLAMAMAVRMPFPRPELLTMMAQASQIRPPMLFNPMFMGAVMPGIPPHQPSHHPVPPTHFSAPPSNISQSNG
ncbi:hypothetical protein DINM_003803 [Dirofilaria immitis]|nr:hypothetical protein [Dirofilaria immitis]